jgi:transcriptional regulator GlxA family with amidase domain
MKRRDFLRTTGTAGLGVLPSTAAIHLAAQATDPAGESSQPIVNGEPLTPPTRGKIRVAVAIAEHATVIDFAGPWEVFQDVQVPARGASHDEQMPFELYTVAATAEPIAVSGGMQIIPNYTVKNAPAPHVVVVPAQHENRMLLDWLSAIAPKTDVTFSVCTGAFLLAETGLLDGLPATTHHAAYDRFAREFPRVKLERGLRFVENHRLSTAGGLTSGIDLALRVVERYFGRAVAQTTADYMEYTGTRWKV